MKIAVAPSPEPAELIELDTIRLLMHAAVTVVCAGGCIPVVDDGSGGLRGAEAQACRLLLEATAAIGRLDQASALLDGNRRHDRRAGDLREEKRMSGPGDGQHRIVAGIDGSESSKNALRWVARQAELTGATLEVVTGWDYPAFYGWAPAIPDDLDFGHFAERAQQEALDDVFGADRPARLETRVVTGHPALALVEAAEGADLLVVGCRGHGGFTDALLGSVSTYCVHHSHCPVTVVRPADHATK